MKFFALALTFAAASKVDTQADVMGMSEAMTLTSAEATAAL